LFIIKKFWGLERSLFWIKKWNLRLKAAVPLNPRNRPALAGQVPRILIYLLFLSITCSPASAQIKATIDPSELAAGARPLGLGRAYVGMADDAYSLFQNPAGLAGTKSWQAASLYSKLIEEVDYNLFGFTYPLSRECLGLGYVKAAVGGSLLSRRDPVTDRIVPIGGAIGYVSSVTFFSYSLALGKHFPFLNNYYLGGNLKLFNQALTGVPSGDASASGMDLDLGLQAKPYSWLTLGAAGYNLLPYSMGGRLNWNTQISESIPASAKLGLAIKILGAGSLKEIRTLNQDLFFSYDYEFTPTRSRPALQHLGVEWVPHDILSLRLGLDQDAGAVGDGTIGVYSNFSAGIGITLFKTRFDYAFHTFGELPANHTHFFSLSYGIEREKWPPFVPSQLAYLKIDEPTEKSITYNPYLIIKGKVLDKSKIKEVKINSDTINLYPDASFFAITQLPKLGKNLVELVPYNLTGRILKSTQLAVIRVPTFSDVPDTHPLRQTVGGFALLGYVSGYPDQTFRPNGRITRAEICKILMKIKEVETAESSKFKIFKDVPATHWAAGFINRSAQEELVKGYPNKTFGPSRNISRAEAVSILAKFAGLKVTERLFERPFPDMNIKHWAAPYVDLAKKAGLLTYLTGQKFNPKKAITRIEVIEILSKIEAVSKKLKELFDC